MDSAAIDIDKWSEHYDHLDPELAADPVPIWAAMRERCPMARSDRHGGFWVPTTSEVIAQIAHDPATFSSERAMLIDIGSDSFPPIASDPPVHTRFRRLLLPAFSPQSAARWESTTWDIANALLDDLVDLEEIDASSQYAQLVPITVISRMLGVDEEDHERFTGWVHQIDQSESPEEMQAGAVSLAVHLGKVIDEHRTDPRDDLITALLESEVDGEKLSDVDVIGACVVLLIAGFDTTWGAIGSSLHHLATTPEDRRRLVAALDEPEPVLWPMAIEEFLRAFAAVTQTRRVVADVEIDGQLLRAGDLTLLPFLAANRDPAAFDRPDEVIIDRRDNRHVAFGIGIHRCLGAHLARMELRVALQAFLRRVPDFGMPDGAVVTYGGANVRGPRHVPLALHRDPVLR